MVEQLKGIDAIFYIQEWNRKIDGSWADLQENMTIIWDNVMTTNGTNMYVNLLGDKPLLDSCDGAVDRLVRKLHKKPSSSQEWNAMLVQKNEGFIMPSYHSAC